MKGIQVDGNDIFAMYQAVKNASDYALAGNGPVLIEAVTYRKGAHTTSDDPTKYRTKEEVEEYIKSYLKYKFFEQMWHSVMDESAKQVTDKLTYYKREQLEKLQAAYNYLMTKSKQQIADSIVRTRNRFSKFHIK
jgi:pyruvate dehydrogenase E1 component alpha subunit